jgi:DNA-binding transcriptional regulator YdaS (Cro superfamily)
MQLYEWVDKRGHGEIARLCRESGVSNTTIHEAIRRAPISRYPIAKAISDATGGAVTPAELLAPENPTEPSWKKYRRTGETPKRTRGRRKSSPGSRAAK